MTREAALLGLLADLATDRDALIAQRDALKAENTELRAIVADLEHSRPRPTTPDQPHGKDGTLTAAPSTTEIMRRIDETEGARCG